MRANCNCLLNQLYYWGSIVRKLNASERERESQVYPPVFGCIPDLYSTVCVCCMMNMASRQINKIRNPTTFFMLFCFVTKVKETEKKVRTGINRITQGHGVVVIVLIVRLSVRVRMC